MRGLDAISYLSSSSRPICIPETDSLPVVDLRGLFLSCLDGDEGDIEFKFPYDYLLFLELTFVLLRNF